MKTLKVCDLVEGEILDVAVRRSMCDYMASCPSLLAGRAGSIDRFNPEGALIPDAVYCDGEWVWHQEAAHYILAYGLRPSHDFIEHALTGSVHKGAFSDSVYVLLWEYMDEHGAISLRGDLVDALY